MKYFKISIFQPDSFWQGICVPPHALDDNHKFFLCTILILKNNYNNNNNKVFFNYISSTLTRLTNQIHALQKISNCYRTVSYESLCVLMRIPPLKLRWEKLAMRFYSKTKRLHPSFPLSETMTAWSNQHHSRKWHEFKHSHKSPLRIRQSIARFHRKNKFPNHRFLQHIFCGTRKCTSHICLWKLKCNSNTPWP